MRRPALLFTMAGLLFGSHVVANAAGWADHTSAISGMPQSTASWVIGPLFVALYLALVIVAPILTIAGTVDTLLLLRRR